MIFKLYFREKIRPNGPAKNTNFILLEKQNPSISLENKDNSLQVL